ncbi:hypothetical protein QBC39DRAFT_382633 [Podospora conica]|nr:hypothetical protein QBC39DRAFT_382633 [Schizothecium conicum]
MIRRLPLHVGASSSRLFTPGLLHRVRYSSSSGAAAAATSPPNPSPPPKLQSPFPFYPPELVNPPASARPPPLVIAPHDPENESKPRYYFNQAVTYLTFYKRGLSQILANGRLLGPNPPAPGPPPADSRAYRLLASRYRHDRNLLYPFGLLLLVCGELTPFVVLLLPRMVPYTCRTPLQVEQLERRHDTKRQWDAWFLEMAEFAEDDDRIKLAERIAVGRVSALMPSVREWPVLRQMLSRRVERRLREVEEDDAALAPEGAVEALVTEELRMAAMDRGLMVMYCTNEVLRWKLRAWLNCPKDDKDAYFKLLARGEQEMVKRGVLPKELARVPWALNDTECR